MHNTDLTEKSECGKNYGLKVNYSLLFRIENLVEEIYNWFEKRECYTKKKIFC